MERYQKYIISFVLLVTFTVLSSLVLKPDISGLFVQRQGGPEGYAMTPGDLEANLSVGETKSLTFHVWNGHQTDRDVVVSLNGNLTEVGELEAPEVIPYRIWTPITTKIIGDKEGIYSGTVYVNMGIVGEKEVSQGDIDMGMNILVKMKKGITVRVS